MHFLTGRLAYGSMQMILDDVTIKNPDEFIKQSFKMPPTHHNYYKCYSTLYKTLTGIVSDRIIEMVKANNIDGVITSLGGGKKTSNIAELVKNKKLEELEEIKAKIRIYTLREDEKRLEKWKLKEKNVYSRLQVLEERFKDIINQNCNICFDKLENPVMESQCQNIFCTTCLLTWLKNEKSCPLCRCKVDAKKLIYITSDEKSEDKIHEHKPLTKESTIINIINNNPSGRFVIYSAHDETFNTIKRVFDTNDISFIEIKGRPDDVSTKIEKFKNGDVQVIFLNSKFNGAGLNLIETTDIIVYHEMSPDTLKQILGRPNRIGRTIPLQVHHLVYE